MSSSTRFWTFVHGTKKKGRSIGSLPNIKNAEPSGSQLGLVELVGDSAVVEVDVASSQGEPQAVIWSVPHVLDPSCSAGNNFVFSSLDSLFLSEKGLYLFIRDTLMLRGWPRLQLLPRHQAGPDFNFYPDISC